VTVLDAAGKNPVIVETVGVGQDEVDIVKLADVSIVVLVPGMGDDIQALKAGIMEIGDIFVINKCDRPGVGKMERAIQAMQSLAPHTKDWEPPIVRVTATEGDGIEELWRAIADCHSAFQSQPIEADRRRQATRDRLVKLMQERLVGKAMESAFPGDELERVVDAISRRETDPYSVVEELIKSLSFKRREESTS
jgi:LAO/AO transport system kinase